MCPRMAGGCLFMMLACAAQNRAVLGDLNRVEGSPGLFVGHTQDGELVVAASHFDAMSGLATTDADLGLDPRKDVSGVMLCAREVVTGSHFPHWICRYKDDVQAARERVQAFMQSPRLTHGPGARITSSSNTGQGGSVPY
jgi:hypothetical protein